MTKKWTFSEKIFLYKFVKENGTLWTDVSKILECSVEAARKQYKGTHWKEFFSKYNIDEKKIDKYTDKDIEKLKTIYEQKKEVSIEEDVLSSIEEHKEKILKNAEVRRHTENLKNYATTELIIEKIIAAVESRPKIKVEEIKTIKIDKTETKPQQAVLILSDLHLGLAVNPEEVGGFSNYNPEIFKRRLWSLVEKVIKITGHHRKTCQIDTLNIFNLGDNVHGSNDAGQWGFLHTEQNIMDQILMLWTELEKAILTLSKHFKNIKFYGVTGNHGRIGQKGAEKLFVNWDFLLYKILEKSLSSQENIKIYAPRSPFQVANIMGNKFLLTHGSEVKSWGGIPFYGMVRAESKYRNLFERNKNIDGVWEEMEKLGINKLGSKEMIKFAFEYCKTFDYLVLGHKHQMVEFESSAGGRIIMNSSFVGGDDFSINGLLSASTPCQKFFGIHPEGKSFSYDIDLDRE